MSWEIKILSGGKEKLDLIEGLSTVLPENTKFTGDFAAVMILKVFVEARIRLFQRWMEYILISELEYASPKDRET